MRKIEVREMRLREMEEREMKEREKGEMKERWKRKKMKEKGERNGKRGKNLTYALITCKILLYSVKRETKIWTYSSQKKPPASLDLLAQGEGIGCCPLEGVDPSLPRADKREPVDRSFRVGANGILLLSRKNT